MSVRPAGFVFVALLLALMPPATFAQAKKGAEAARPLPARAGEFRAQGPARPLDFAEAFGAAPEEYGAVSATRRAYLSPSGNTLTVSFVQTASDSAAFSLLTRAATRGEGQGVRVGHIGTAHAVLRDVVAFFKGAAFVEVTAADRELALDPEELKALAHEVAATLDEGAATLPSLALHLPGWEEALPRAEYVVTLPALLRSVGNLPALEAVAFDGGEEAATATYGPSRVVVVEHTTPQYAADNDVRIGQRIAQLRAAGQPVPSFYQRVGNYSVFVFGAPDERAAAELAGQVKYEKDVRWLGENPYAEERAQRAYTVTMGGVIFTTLKITGLAIVTCLGLGGLVGGLIFFLRRSRSTATEAYSDAGGMMRLNLEDVNAPRPAARLPGAGER